MGIVKKLFVEPDRDEEGKIEIEEGQKWVDKVTGLARVVSCVDRFMVDDEEQVKVYLEPLFGESDDDHYTEKYFREWFSEFHEYQGRKNRIALRNRFRNLGRWKTFGTVIAEEKEEKKA